MTFWADIYAGERRVFVRRFEAADTTEALETARQEVVALGHDRADVYRGDYLNTASYVDTVEAQ